MTAEPAKKKPTRVWLVILMALGIPLVGLAALVGVGVLLSSTGKDLPPGDADRAAVLTIEELGERLQDFTPKPNVAKLTKRKLLDGSHELSYEYDTSTDAKGGLYLNCVITVEKDATDARNSYLGMKLGGAAGFAITSGKGVSLQDREDLLKWGDDSHSAVLTVDGKPGGNFFIARKGTHIFYLIVAGVFFDSPENLSSLLVPKLEQLAQYKP
jgi:hypothetical protein